METKDNVTPPEWNIALEYTGGGYEEFETTVEAWDAANAIEAARGEAVAKHQSTDSDGWDVATAELVASPDCVNAMREAIVQLLLAFAKGEDSEHIEWEDLNFARDMADDALPGEYERILAELRAQTTEDLTDA